MASSAAAMKAVAVCVVLLCIGSDFTRPALATSLPDDQEAAAGALLRELLEHELAEELGLLGDVCTPACKNCLIVCAITCVLNKDPVACFANCTVTSACFSKTLLVAITA